jgi:renalase
MDVVVVGAGLSGLTAARALLRAGHTVQVVDEGRGVGGRLATRRIGDATFDHGAQFFTVRGEAFRETVDAALAANVAAVWCYGFTEDDGYPRYFCPGGMTSLAKWLAAEVVALGGAIHTERRVAAVTAVGSSWQLRAEEGPSADADAVILTPPVPQALELLREGGIDIAEPTCASLEAIAYKPTLAVLATLDGPSAIPSPGGVQLTEDDLFTFVSDNEQKGVSATPAVTLHVNGTVSAHRWDEDRAVVLSDLLESARPWFGDANVVEAQLMAWKYAGPFTPYPDACAVVAATPGPLVLAGDAFAGPKVEGAFNSGLAAAEAIARH